MQVISFSLWGSNPKYTVGAIRNKARAAAVYPGWQCWFYVDVDSVPADVVKKLEGGNSRVIPMHKGNWTSMFWRFLTVDQPGVTYNLSRDADSRVSPREKAAVVEWMASGKALHVMRDHPCHDVPIMGGMWGLRAGVVNVTKLLAEFNHRSNNQYQVDQTFLRNKLWPLLKGNVLVHDSMHRDGYKGGPVSPFPTARVGLEFVGEVYDEQGKPNAGHRAKLSRWCAGQNRR